MSVSLTLTLSGGAALGAFEAGGTAALMEAAAVLRSRGHAVTIDAVGGASAGALVAMFAAHAHANNIDPVWILHEAWVERVSLELLRARGLTSPLGFERLTERIDELLDPRDGAGRPAHRRTDGVADHPVGLHVALTGLRGLHYPVRGLGVLNPVRASTYADWGGFTLQPGGGAAAIREPDGASILDFVLASAANPGAFAPRSVDRSRDVDGYRDNGIGDLPEPPRLWYTDGGTLQVEPIGRVLTAARKARKAAGRSPAERHVTLLIDPRSETPEPEDAFAGDSRPSWIEGIARSLEIIPAQILYDDLRRVEKVNSRLSWAGRLAATLAPHIDADARGDLASLLGEVADERNRLRVSDQRQTDAAVADDESNEALLTRLLALVAGLERKHFAEADVISPLLLAEQGEAHVQGLLAGEILGDFGGFLNRGLRESDFLLGFDCALTWLEANLERLDVPPASVDAALARLRERVPQRWEQHSRGQAELGDLPWHSRLGLVKLVGRMAAVLGRNAVDSVRK